LQTYFSAKRDSRPRADSAEDAIRVLRSVRPDMMLVDIQLPGMDGLELARRTKQDPQTQDIVVLALTASTGQDRGTALPRPVRRLYYETIDSDFRGANPRTSAQPRARRAAEAPR